MTPTRISVGGGYDVVVGHDVTAELAGLLGDTVHRVLLVHPAALAARGELVRSSLVEAGFDTVVAAVPDGEAAKTAEVAADLWGVLGRADFTRTDAVVGLGGGTVTDLAGFVAATWLRGIRVVQVPTTLLGMVDAAVGGKTGINTAEGKNLVGSFHPPAGVLCDLTSLRSLPAVDLTAGLAEVVKCGFIADPQILELVESDPVDAAVVDGGRLRELIERAITVKAEVVAQDLKESSLREILNYGHTFGHAVEQVEQFQRRHGEAVAIGMVFVAELARLAGGLDAAVTQRHRDVLSAVGLPTSYRDDRWDLLLTAMRRDKKTRGSTLRFVVLEDIARPARLEGPAPELLEAAYAALTG